MSSATFIQYQQISQYLENIDKDIFNQETIQAIISISNYLYYEINQIQSFSNDLKTSNQAHPMVRDAQEFIDICQKPQFDQFQQQIIKMSFFKKSRANFIKKLQQSKKIYQVKQQDQENEYYIKQKAREIGSLSTTQILLKDKLQRPYKNENDRAQAILEESKLQRKYHVERNLQTLLQSKENSKRELDQILLKLEDLRKDLMKIDENESLLGQQMQGNSIIQLAKVNHSNIQREETSNANKNIEQTQQFSRVEMGGSYEDLNRQSQLTKLFLQQQLTPHFENNIYLNDKEKNQSIEEIQVQLIAQTSKNLPLKSLFKLPDFVQKKFKLQKCFNIPQQVIQIQNFIEKENEQNQAIKFSIKLHKIENFKRTEYPTTLREQEVQIEEWFQSKSDSDFIASTLIESFAQLLKQTPANAIPVIIFFMHGQTSQNNQQNSDIQSLTRIRPDAYWIGVDIKENSSKKILKELITKNQYHLDKLNKKKVVELLKNIKENVLSKLQEEKIQKKRSQSQQKNSLNMNLSNKGSSNPKKHYPHPSSFLQEDISFKQTIDSNIKLYSEEPKFQISNTHNQVTSDNSAIHSNLKNEKRNISRALEDYEQRETLKKQEIQSIEKQLLELNLELSTLNPEKQHEQQNERSVSDCHIKVDQQLMRERAKEFQDILLSFSNLRNLRMDLINDIIQKGEDSAEIIDEALESLSKRRQITDVALENASMLVQKHGLELIELMPSSEV